MESEGVVMAEIDPTDMMGYHDRISSKLLNNHIYFLNGLIDDYSSQEVIKWILYENTIKEENKVLTLYINSDGGDLTNAFAIVDIMRQSNYKIKTIGIGSIISAGFLIFACGEKGMRIISRNTSIMIHQYSAGILGKQHDLEAQYKELSLVKDRLVTTFREVTGLKDDVIKNKLMPPSDVWMTPEELLKYNVADIIV